MAEFTAKIESYSISIRFIVRSTMTGKPSVEKIDGRLLEQNVSP
jgi:hypothetical protein